MKVHKIALTGGPGGGKTTAADLFQRELRDQLVMVPEAATLLFRGGFPRTGESAVMKATQRAIYHVLKNLEESISAHCPGRSLLCDRGTVDGAAYWPGSFRDFFLDVGATKTPRSNTGFLNGLKKIADFVSDRQFPIIMF